MNSPMIPAPRLPEGLPSAWLLDCEIFAEAILPDPDLTITQWADDRRVLPPESSPEPGPWRTDRVPYAREIMDVLSPSDPTSEVTFVAGAQVAKTEIGNNFIGFIIDHAPGPVMMVYATSSTGRRSSHTRLAKMLDSTPSLREKVSNKARDKANSALRKDFPGGVLMIAGANSASDLASQPVRFLFEDELDKYPDDVDGHGPAVELAETRTRNFPRRKIYRASTPLDNGPRKIWGFFLASDQRRYHVPCPHCGEFQVLRWEQFRHETRKVWERIDAESGEVTEVAPGAESAISRDTGDLLDVWYECEHCSARIDEHSKTEMLARGKWIAARPEVKGHAGFHLPSFYSPLGWYSWMSIAKKRLEADKDPTQTLLKQWTNETAGEPFSARGEAVSDLQLKERAEDYRRGTIPLPGLLLIASVDVQADRLEVKLKAYGRGEESWLVDYQVIHGDTETSPPWSALDEYLLKPVPHECGVTLRITATAIDAGYRTQTVYAFCRQRTHRHVFPVRGQSQPGKTVLGRPSAQDIDHNGQKIPGGIQLWPVGSDTAKSKIYARLKIAAPGPGCMHFPLGLPDEYFQQLTAERLVPKYVRGYLKRVWEKEASARNEALDLEVYCYAAFHYAGGQRANWDRLEATLRATSQDLFVAAQAGVENQQAVAQKDERSSPAAEQKPNTKSAPAPAPARPNFANRWKR